MKAPGPSGLSGEFSPMFKAEIILLHQNLLERRRNSDCLDTCCLVSKGLPRSLWSYFGLILFWPESSLSLYLEWSGLKVIPATGRLQVQSGQFNESLSQQNQTKQGGDAAQQEDLSVMQEAGPGFNTPVLQKLKINVNGCFRAQSTLSLVTIPRGQRRTCVPVLLQDAFETHGHAVRRTCILTCFLQGGC